MKVIIRRDKQTKKIIGDFDEYEIFNKGGETEADIYARVEAFNKQKFHGSIAEIVEPDDISIEAGLARGQIRRVYRLGVVKEVRYVRLLPDDDNTFVLIVPEEYVVLENYTGGEV